MEHLTHSAAETEALGCRLGCALTPGTVIATGGGMVLAEENRRFMRENGIVLYLPPRPRSLHPACRPIPTPRNAPHLPGNPLRKR